VTGEVRERNRDRQAEARDAYRASVAAGAPLPARELAERFDRSPRWGRQVIADTVAAERRNGSHPTPERQPRPAEPAALAATDEKVAAAPQARSWLDSLITLAVALVAAAASYGHMLHVAEMAGEPVWIARAFPITVDGLVLAALRRGEEGRGWLALGAAVSVACNVLAQFPETAAAAGPVVSAWPPVALYGTHRLLHHRDRQTGDKEGRRS
jgi:hypothetical protein